MRTLAERPQAYDCFSSAKLELQDTHLTGQCLKIISLLSLEKKVSGAMLSMFDSILVQF
jgi:hypothetical protein